MLNKKTVRDIEVSNKKVLVRCDFNVPLDKETKSIITSDKRIIESLKTIKYLINAGAKVILCSHIGKTGKNISLAPVAKRLEELLKIKVELLPEIVGEKVSQRVNELKPGEVVLLENLRMFEEEEQNDEDFSKKLASLAEVFVNDAFGTAHRAHASTYGVTKYLPAVSGFLIEKEIEALDHYINAPKRPFTAIIGGLKVSSKIGVITALLDKVDNILIGGAMTYTFVKAMGGNVGNSIYEEDKIDVAKEILEKAKSKNINLMLPIDNVIATELSSNADISISKSGDIPEGYMGVDIGPETIKKYIDVIKSSETVVWNGPLGAFEIEEFFEGTRKIATTLANEKIVSIIGGGDSAAAIEQLSLEENMTHVSTGGGASLEFLEGKKLPGIEALIDK